MSASKSSKKAAFLYLYFKSQMHVCSLIAFPKRRLLFYVYILKVSCLFTFICSKSADCFHSISHESFQFYGNHQHFWGQNSSFPKILGKLPNQFIFWIPLKIHSNPSIFVRCTDFLGSKSKFPKNSGNWSWCQGNGLLDTMS